MLRSSADYEFVQRFSVLKTMGIEALLLVLSGLPLTPRFSENLKYTLAFYQPPLNVLLFIVCGFLGLLFLILLPLLWRAIRGMPAIEVTDDVLTVYGLNGRSIVRSSVKNLEVPKFGNSTLHVEGEPSLTLPIFLYKDSRTSWERIRALLDENNAQLR